MPRVYQHNDQSDESLAQDVVTNPERSTTMRTYLLALAIMFTFSMAYAKEYGNYDPKRMLTASETPSGKKYGIDLVYLDQMLGDLSFHAKNYPPQFDTPQDRQRAIRDVKTLSGMLDILIQGSAPHPDFLIRAGSLNSIGHNLDIAGSGEKTILIFQRLLAAAPNHPSGNFMYGTFLAGVGKSKEALPYLEKALSVGVNDAAYTIGMTYLSLGNKDKAVASLELYRRKNPNDPNVGKLIDAIRNGKIEIKKKSS